MCLLIAKCKHKQDDTGRFIPLTAEKDIHVYKQVLHTTVGCRYYTLYRYSPVMFRNGIYEMATKKFSFKESDGFEFVYRGIHARRSKTMDGVRFRHIHHAIIPKGTQYFLGRMNDIVALKVITFASESDYDKYCKENNTSPKDISHLYTGY